MPDEAPGDKMEPKNFWSRWTADGWHFSKSITTDKLFEIIKKIIRRIKKCGKNLSCGWQESNRN